MQKFVKTLGLWVDVDPSEWNDEAIRAYEIMEAHVEIAALEEAMKLNIDLKKQKN